MHPRKLRHLWGSAVPGFEEPQPVNEPVQPDQPVQPPDHPCSCGSGLESYWANDARGIPLGRVCESCRKERLSKFRPEVLTDPCYEVDEPIDPD